MVRYRAALILLAVSALLLAPSLVLGTMIAIGRWEEFEMHAAAALREGGFTNDDLKEIVLQQAIYCGVPAAHHALKILGALSAQTKHPGR